MKKITLRTKVVLALALLMLLQLALQRPLADKLPAGVSLAQLQEIDLYQRRAAAGPTQVAAEGLREFCEQARVAPAIAMRCGRPDYEFLIPDATGEHSVRIMIYLGTRAIRVWQWEGGDRSYLALGRIEDLLYESMGLVQLYTTAK